MTSSYIIYLLILLQLSVSQKLVLVGGALDDDNEQIYGKFIEMATDSQGKQYIGIITGASDPLVAQENGLFYVNIMKKFHANNTEWIPIHLDNPDVAFNQEWVTKVSQMTGVFFGGGDQSRLTKLFKTSNSQDTPLLAIIRENVNNNKTVVGGSSAGTTIQQKTPMLTGGYSYHSLKQLTQDHIDINGDLVSYDLTGGFGLLSLNIYLDTHFGHRGRQGRLIALMYDLSQSSNAYFGAGIDQNTALVVDGYHGLILGEGGVSFFDLRNSKGQRTDGQLNIEGVSLTYLTQGDEFNLQTFEMIRYDCAKTHINGKERHDGPMVYVQDIFDSPDLLRSDNDVGQFTHVVQDLLDCKHNETQGFSAETNPHFRIDFIKNEKTRGYYDTENRDVISVDKLTINVTPQEAISQEINMAEGFFTLYLNNLLQWYYE